MGWVEIVVGSVLIDGGYVGDSVVMGLVWGCEYVDF